MEMDAKLLKEYGIVLGKSSLIVKAYETLKGVPILPIEGKPLLVLNLDLLPTKPLPFKEIFLKWALKLNEGRMLSGEEPIFPYELVKSCPLWKVIRMPITSVEMTKESIFGKPDTRSAIINGAVPKKKELGSINKR